MFPCRFQPELSGVGRFMAPLLETLSFKGLGCERDRRHVPIRQDGFSRDQNGSGHQGIPMSKLLQFCFIKNECEGF